MVVIATCHVIRLSTIPHTSPRTLRLRVRRDRQRNPGALLLSSGSPSPATARLVLVCPVAARQPFPTERFPAGVPTAHVMF